MASDTFRSKSQKQNKECRSYFEDLKARIDLLILESDGRVIQISYFK